MINIFGETLRTLRISFAWEFKTFMQMLDTELDFGQVIKYSGGGSGSMKSLLYPRKAFFIVSDREIKMYLQNHYNKSQYDLYFWYVAEKTSSGFRVSDLWEYITEVPKQILKPSVESITTSLCSFKTIDNGYRKLLREIFFDDRVTDEELSPLLNSQLFKNNPDKVISFLRNSQYKEFADELGIESIWNDPAPMPKWITKVTGQLLGSDREKILKDERDRNFLTELHEKYNIDYLYHITSEDHLATILKYGLLSHNEAHHEDLIKNDISMSSVQKRRENMEDPIYGRQIHDYVNLYFSPRNAMLYKRRKCQSSLIILGINPLALKYEATIFTDRNVASYNPQFYKSVSQLDQLQWKIINSHYWTDYWTKTGHESGKSIKMAEVLVYPKVKVQNLKVIFCYNREQRKRCSTISRDKIPVKINEELYF